VATKRSNLYEMLLNLDTLKLTYIINVDEMSRARQPKGHHGDKTLSARQNANIFITELSEQPDSVIDCAWHMVSEWRRLHVCSFVNLAAIKPEALKAYCQRNKRRVFGQILMLKKYNQLSFETY
jgi:hypothetical protein